MLYLQATKKARDALGIGREVLGPPSRGSSVFGDWLLNVVPIGDREAFLFMNSLSLLSFPIFIGQLQPSLEDIPGFLSHGVSQLMQAMGTSSQRTSRLLQELQEIAVCKATDKSLLGVSAAVAADYFHMVNHRGGLSGVEMSAIVVNVNSTPRATLGWHHSMEAARELLNANPA